MSHTPGPWRASQPQDDVARYVRADDGTLLCKCYWPDELGNARLIAAAPDLLEALKRTSEILFAEYGPKIYRANFMFIEEAIKKARG